jgi:hypothetical protein
MVTLAVAPCGCFRNGFVSAPRRWPDALDLVVQNAAFGEKTLDVLLG